MHIFVKIKNYHQKIEMANIDNIEKPFLFLREVIIHKCPNCNTELIVYDKCDLCGWEKKKGSKKRNIEADAYHKR